MNPSPIESDVRSAGASMRLDESGCRSILDSPIFTGGLAGGCVASVTLAIYWILSRRAYRKGNATIKSRLDDLEYNDLMLQTAVTECQERVRTHRKTNKDLARKMESMETVNKAHESLRLHGWI